MSSSISYYGYDEKVEGVVEGQSADLQTEPLQQFEMDNAINNFKTFGDVKFVCFVESIENMRNMVVYINKAFVHACIGQIDYIKISEYANIAMMKAGPVLVVSYGNGAGPLLIALHEVEKLLNEAGADDPTFLLLESSAGIGVLRGSVIINTVVLNRFNGCEHKVNIEGEQPKHCALDENICRQMKKTADLYIENFPVFLGKILCSHYFCEDENLHDFDKHKKVSYLREIRKIGALNHDVVSATFAGTCTKFGLKAGIISVALIDSIKDDEIPLSMSTMRAWKNRVYYLTSLYLKEKLEGNM